MELNNVFINPRRLYKAIVMYYFTPYCYYEKLIGNPWAQDSTNLTQKAQSNFLVTLKALHKYIDSSSEISLNCVS